MSNPILKNKYAVALKQLESNHDYQSKRSAFFQRVQFEQASLQIQDNPNLDLPEPYQEIDTLITKTAYPEIHSSVKTCIFSFSICTLTFGVAYALNSFVGAVGMYGVGVALIASTCSSLNNIIQPALNIRQKISSMWIKIKEIKSDLKLGYLDRSDLKHWFFNGLLIYIVLQGGIPSAAPLARGFDVSCEILKGKATNETARWIITYLLAPLSPMVKWAETFFLVNDIHKWAREYFDRWGLTQGDGGAIEDWKKLQDLVKTNPQAKTLYHQAIQERFIGGVYDPMDRESLDLLPLSFTDARSPEREVVKHILKTFEPKLSGLAWLYEKITWAIKNALSALLMTSYIFTTAPVMTALYQARDKDWVDYFMILTWVMPEALCNEWVAAVLNCVQVPLFLDFLNQSLSAHYELIKKTILNPEGFSAFTRIKNLVIDTALVGFFFMTTFNLMQVANSGTEGVNFGSPRFMLVMNYLLPPFAYVSNSQIYSNLRNLDLKTFFSTCLLRKCRHSSCFSSEDRQPLLPHVQANRSGATSTGGVSLEDFGTQDGRLFQPKQIGNSTLYRWWTRSPEGEGPASSAYQELTV